MRCQPRCDVTYIRTVVVGIEYYYVDVNPLKISSYTAAPYGKPLLYISVLAKVLLGGMHVVGMDVVASVLGTPK